MNQWARALDADALPTAAADANTSSSGASSSQGSVPSLTYQSKIAPGQIRRERSNGTLTLRVMLPTGSRILDRSVPQIGVAVLFAFLAGCDIYRIWFAHRSAPSASWQYESFFRVDVLIWAGLFIYMCLQIAKALSRRARGTTLINVSHDGLGLSNGPGPLRNGYFCRAQIEGMAVALDQVGVGQRIYRLEAHIVGDHDPVILLVGPDPKRLENIRRELLKAMGII
jgi:hypothetical protein